MTAHIPEELSTGLIDWRPFVILDGDHWTREALASYQF